ncbi:MAG: DUF2384 domain-containing protein [Deltaproteobacteria bacterium]|nr:DUF2384 domain-containing protein [Deltaproteobacteria bacterium]
MKPTASTPKASKIKGGSIGFDLKQLRKNPDMVRNLSKALQKISRSGRMQTIQAIKRGVAYTTFEILQKEIGVPREALAKTVNIASRTLHRRKQEGKFRSDESERIYRAARLFDRTLALFDGDIDQARSWFNTSKKALGGKTPMEFADTELGAQEVLDLIGRLEHGVFS